MGGQQGEYPQRTTQQSPPRSESRRAKLRAVDADGAASNDTTHRGSSPRRFGIAPAGRATRTGIPSKIVDEVPGHSSTRVTEDTYQHVAPGMKADATARVAALLRVR